MELYRYILPIIPNPNEYLYSVIELIVPVIFMYHIYKFYKKDQDEEVKRHYHKRHIGTLIIPTCIVIFLVYITSGYFRYHAIAIASGSMVPSINKGDVVIIEKVENNKGDIELGEVIAYRYNNVIIVHRLVKKVKIDDKYFFYTKGDANHDIDNYEITEDMIIGTVDAKIPYIGYPTVWINEL